MNKRPESVLVLVHSAEGRILLLYRAGEAGFWQSVTGSLEIGEAPRAAAQREVAEETGIDAATQDFVDWRMRNRFSIPARWLRPYPPGTTHNTEHVFSLCVADGTPVRLCEREHSAARWSDPSEALDLAWSWTNRDAIRLLPLRLPA